MAERLFTEAEVIATIKAVAKAERAMKRRRKGMSIEEMARIVWSHLAAGEGTTEVETLAPSDIACAHRARERAENE